MTAFRGAAVCTEICESVKSFDKLFCNERSAADSVNESFSQLMCSNDTAIQSIYTSVASDYKTRVLRDALDKIIAEAKRGQP